MCENPKPVMNESDYENYWQQLRHHIEWTDGFGLFYYFCDDPQLIVFLHDRLEQFLKGQTTRLQTVNYTPKDNDWINSSLDHLLSRDDEWKLLHSPVWINLTESSNKQAYSDYSLFLQRINERRDLLRTHYHEPVILLFPVSFQEQCRLAAPDLWSIRNFSETIARPPAPKLPASRTNTRQQDSDNQFSTSTSSTYLEQLLKEWNRISQTEAKTEEQLYLAQRIAQESVKYGQLSEASEIIKQGLQFAKALEDNREISVCLNISGDIAKQQGRWNDAQASFEESLDISRKLARMLGDSPQALRDLSVSLNNVGDIAKQQGRWNDAQASFEEFLDISRRLAKMLGDSPQALRDLSVSLDNVGGIAKQQGRWNDAQASFEKSLDIRRRLAKMPGDSPQALRDLSVSLNKVGDIAKQKRRWNDAQTSFEESLDIRRRLAKMLGDSPQALRDLSVSLNKVGDIAKQKGRWNDAQASFEESLDISRRLAKMLGDSPEALRDICVALFNNGKLAVKADNRSQAKDFFEEGLDRANRLAKLLPDLPDYAELPEYFSHQLNTLSKDII